MLKLPIELGMLPLRLDSGKFMFLMLQACLPQAEVQVMPCQGVVDEHGFSGGLLSKSQGYPLVAYGNFHSQYSPLVL